MKQRKGKLNTLLKGELNTASMGELAAQREDTGASHPSRST